MCGYTWNRFSNDPQSRKTYMLRFTVSLAVSLTSGCATLAWGNVLPRRANQRLGSERN